MGRAAAMEATNAAVPGLGLGVLCLFCAVMVLAADNGVPASSTADYDAALKREILENADRWRVPEPDQQWRPPPPRQAGRMTLGFDSVYEEALDRKLGPTDQQIGDRQTKPSSVFRLEF